MSKRIKLVATATNPSHRAGAIYEADAIHAAADVFARHADYWDEGVYPKRKYRRRDMVAQDSKDDSH